ncbi:Hypothetical predicted protein [Lecanosticta acicola]|uniref:Methyltransferase type 11 domain-containing protein n=1 Tax=Lecanosticta acicola TaxID=111012 RepID=A0AAI8W0M6_9PEZI|nr:Hypothetical predicted protein [Lecanosticta acicola]
MSPDKDQEIQYTYLDSHANWPTYQHYRPSYPAATENLILTYHRSHSNSLRLAHDVGAGAGAAIFAPRLAEYFQHVHISDPSPTTLSRAREKVGEFYRENWWKGTFSLSLGTAEACQEAFARQSVDLVSLMMMAHWPEDTGRMMDAVAESLAPNGTLVVVSYAPCCSVVGDAGVNTALEGLWEAWGSNFARDADRRIERNNSPLDFIGLREEEGDGVWLQDVTKRIKINFRDRGDAAFVIPGSGGRVAESKVGEKQRKYLFSDEDEEGAGWRKEVDAAWFRGYIGSLEKEENLGSYEEHLRELERVIREMTKDGTVVVEWAVSILLATKK